KQSDLCRLPDLKLQSPAKRAGRNKGFTGSPVKLMRLKTAGIFQLLLRKAVEKTPPGLYEGKTPDAAGLFQRCLDGADSLAVFIPAEREKRRMNVLRQSRPFVQSQFNVRFSVGSIACKEMQMVVLLMKR